MLSHVGKPFVAFAQATWHPQTKAKMHTESGYLRVPNDNTVEFVVCDPTGVAQVYHGTVQGEPDGRHELRLTTSSVTCTASAKTVTALTRTFVVEGNQLTYTVDMQAVGQHMQTHLVACLQRMPPLAVSLAELSDAAMVDVREESEAQAIPAPAPTSVVPLGRLLHSLGNDLLEKALPFNKSTCKIVCLCQSGERAALAAESLRQAGYAGACYLDQGLAGWTAQ